jgi:DNA-binding beta-propeller fold protein YncE
MAHRSRAVAALPALLLALSSLSAGCGEPLVVLGDAPGLMRLVLGVGDSMGTRVDTLATRTRLTDPRAVAFDAATSLLRVADRGSLRQVSGTTTRVARIFSVTSSGRSTLLLDTGGSQQGTCLLEPTSMAVTRDGSLIIADAVGSRLFRYVPGGALTVLAGTGAAISAPDGSQAAGAPVDRPAGVAVADDGRIFFSESGAHRIRVISAGGILGTVAGTGQRGSAGDGGPAAAAQLDAPAGLALRDGTLYIAEQGAHTVRAIDAGGQIRTVAGIPGGAGFGGDGGPAIAARLNRPYAVSVSSSGRTLFISDRDNDRVRVVDLASGVIRTFAGTGERRYTGSRLSAGQTALHDPAGIDASAGGFIFIADPGHSVVWRTSVGFD